MTDMIPVGRERLQFRYFKYIHKLKAKYEHNEYRNRRHKKENKGNLWSLKIPHMKRKLHWIVWTADFRYCRGNDQWSWISSNKNCQKLTQKLKHREKKRVNKSLTGTISSGLPYI